MSIRTVDPSNGREIRQYEPMTADEAAEAVTCADRAFQDWRRTDFRTRADVLSRAGTILKARADTYARLMAEEMGKPVSQGRSEAEKCAWVCEYYAEHAERFLSPKVIETDASKSFVTHQPLGVVLAVMPWNFPFWQVFRFAAPGLMAGNTAVLKHASNVPGCALAIQTLLADAGLPEHAFRALLIESDKVDGLLAHPGLKAATLTGSTPAGRAVAGAAGRNLKKTVLELGGSDAYLILEDADVAAAAETCATSRLINSGQSCIAAKRFVVVASRLRAFEEQVTERLGRRKVGDPLEEDTDVGPLARMDLRDELHRQVKESVDSGAKLVMGGEVPNSAGSFYPVTLMTDVGPGMPAYEEELFGPAGAVIPVKDEAEAIRVANDSAFGLGAAVFTQDRARGERIAAEELQAGCCFVNDFVKSDPRLPFGGVKESGYGRELSDLGIREFVNQKTVYVA